MVDYQILNPITTPKETRSKYNVGDIYTNAARCLLCGDFIRSKNRHDFNTCSCGNISVDGGSHYVRRSFAGARNTYRNIIEMYADIEGDEYGARY